MTAGVQGTTIATPVTAHGGAPRPRALAGRRRLPGWLPVLVAAVAIALATASAIAALRLHADERREAELLLRDVAAAVNLQSAVTWEAAAAGAGAEEAARRVEEIGEEVALRLDELATIDRGGVALFEVYRSFAEYRRAIAEVLEALRSRPQAALEAHLSAVGPAFAEFDSIIGGAEQHYRAAARATSQAADIGTGTTLVSAAVLLALFFQRASRARHHAAALAGEQRALRMSEERFRSLVQRSSDMITVVDRAGAIRYQSESVQGLLERDAEPLVGTSFPALLHVDDVPVALELLEDRALRGRRLEWRMAHADGRWVQVETIVTDMTHDPRIGGLVLNSRDISERKALEAELAHQAYHDALTGLPNRVLFMDAADGALARAGRSGRPVAVMLLDLDNFKTINDSLGHAAGDELLVAVAKRLALSVRPGDSVARLAGDEFAVLLEESGEPVDAARIAGRIADRLREPFLVHGRRVTTSASIGIVSSSGGSSASELIRNADVAMYHAKADGGARYALFERAMYDAAVARLELESDLRAAVDRDELTLVYQPILDLDDGRVVAVEALARWDRPGHGAVAPSDFVPVLEQLGLIEPVGWWALETAVAQLAAWRQGSDDVHGVLSVNVSVSQLREATLPDRLEALVRRAGLVPGDVVLELTEGALQTDLAATVARLKDLRARGFRIALDDFGTGYSSLGRLRQLPIDIVKIDRSFVAGLSPGSPEVALIKAMLDLARALDLETVAEGIETREQLEMLRSLGCEAGQGFFLARPTGSESVLKASVLQASRRQS